MKIIAAMDSFKGSLSSKKLNEIISKRLKKEMKEVKVAQVPISDGGEGFIDSLAATDKYDIRKVSVFNPLNEKIKSEYLLSKDKKTAVIESAKVIGLDLVSELSPIRASSYGLGQAVIDSVNNGAEAVNISLGGSATNDAGIGLLKALNFEFYNCHNHSLDIDIHNIHEVHRFDNSNALVDLEKITFNAISDVKNIFTGENGATRVFGKQKGLSEEDTVYVDNQIETFRKFIKNSVGKDLNQIEGTGAAGGISGAMSVFLNAGIIHGIDYVLETIDFNSLCEDADLIITGEGRIDHQTFYGKVIQGIFSKASLYNVPVIAIGGSVDTENIPENSEVPVIVSILNGPMSLDEAMRSDITEENLDFTVMNICKFLNEFL